ncbi:PREDICTED: mediator of RNA polymerase II transcription subunit 15-like [Dufourea novaeangliae]|uniref:mediator of RNA polymerase II transcription subunit 15-like n=1 Tax=Dufourea novaeangliae TaxID=178035 RepID=UPI00076786EF|nr:PREDICTED: mediator of RNA polymerase II transcription subunit 15-like [Dufourea novaeangliae]
MENDLQAIILVALISTALAQKYSAQRPARTAQAQIKYDDPSGLKVNWKLFAPQNQWRAHLENSHRTQRGQNEYVHPQQSVQRPQQSQLVQPDFDQAHYKSYQHAQLAEPDPNQYKGYSQGHAVQADPNQYRGYSQGQIVQADPNQYKGYSQGQVVQADPNQYKGYSQGQVLQAEAQPEPQQIQYKAYQQAQAPVQAQPDPVQVQYKAYPQAQVPVETRPDPNQLQYKPLSNAPSHVKQLLFNHFKPQRPYVDPSAFLQTTNYAIPQQVDQQPANAELSHYGQLSENYEQSEQQKIRREYSDRGLQGRIVYKDDYQQPEQQQSPEVQYVPVPIEKLPIPPPSKLTFDKNMPPEIQQLLQFQAQIPYDVIANSISYKPKSLFVPKPLPPDTPGPYQYRSKVYYVNNDQYEPEYETSKPVQEDQRH